MSNYRNEKLLKLAKNWPRCMACLRHNTGGNIVASHSNQQRDGKGIGIKAHDFRIAYLCHECHYEIDDGNLLTKKEKREKWEEAHRMTIGQLFLEGVIKCF